MILEIAVSDAFGAGREYVDPRKTEDYFDTTKYIRHKTWFHPLGNYTDDTEMTTAVAEVLLGCEPSEWHDKRVWADAFLKAFNRSKRKGYAGGFYDFLLTVTDADDFLARIRPDSDRSGGAMRAGSIGLLADEKQVAYFARTQASLTHATPDGQEAAAAAALLVHYVYHRLGKKADIGKYIDEKVPQCPRATPVSWDQEWKGPIKAPGWQHIRASITLLKWCESLTEILKGAATFEGDVDTVLAIVMAAASWSDEIQQDLPRTLIDGLESGTFGKGYLISLDRRLSAKFPRPTP